MWHKTAVVLSFDLITLYVVPTANWRPEYIFMQSSTVKLFVYVRNSGVKIYIMIWTVAGFFFYIENSNLSFFYQKDMFK